MFSKIGVGAMAVVTAGVLATAGCDVGSTPGTPAAQTSGTGTKNPGLFEPCDLPDDAIAAAGLDPSTEDADFSGVEHTGWQVCGWDNGSWFFLGIFATAHTFQEVKDNHRFTDFRPVEVPGREAIFFREARFAPEEVCALAYPTGSGTITVRVDKKGSEQALEDPCAVALRAALSLNDVIPK